MGGEDGKIHTTRHMARPIGKSMSIAHPKSTELMGVVKGCAHSEMRLLKDWEYGTQEWLAWPLHLSSIFIWLLAVSSGCGRKAEMQGKNLELMNS
jgi:hypothetical protein